MVACRDDELVIVGPPEQGVGARRASGSLCDSRRCHSSRYDDRARLCYFLHGSARPQCRVAGTIVALVVVVEAGECGRASRARRCTGSIGIVWTIVCRLIESSPRTCELICSRAWRRLAANSHLTRCGSKPACRCLASISMTSNFPQEVGRDRAGDQLHEGLLPGPGNGGPHRCAGARESADCWCAISSRGSARRSERSLTHGGRQVGPVTSAMFSPAVRVSPWRWRWCGARRTRPARGWNRRCGDV